jgi:hypothetical protein
MLQHFFFAGELLQDGNSTLSDLNIQEYDVVLTSDTKKDFWESSDDNIKVALLSPEGDIALEKATVNVSSTIDNVKEAIFKELEKCMDNIQDIIPVDQQQLFFAGEWLQDGNRTLEDYGFDAVKHVLFLKGDIFYEQERHAETETLLWY